MFDSEEKAFLRAIATRSGDGRAHGACWLAEARDPQWPDSPGLVVLSESDPAASSPKRASARS